MFTEKTISKCPPMRLVSRDLFLVRFSKLANVRNVHYLLNTISVSKHESGSLLDLELLCKLGILICVYLLICYSRIVKEFFCHLAVGAGGRCKEHYFCVIALNTRVCGTNLLVCNEITT